MTHFTSFHTLPNSFLACFLLISSIFIDSTVANVPGVASLLAGVLSKHDQPLPWPLAPFAPNNFIFNDDDRPPECPPCFNCMLPKYECLQFANCSQYDGRCSCPEGFGGDECGTPQCDSLAESQRKLRPPDQKSCQCTPGWGGINCNVCKQDDQCRSMVPVGFEDGAVCHKGAMPVGHQHMMCNVTNPAVLKLLPPERYPQVTIGCNKTVSKCDFQFWVGEVESFYCDLSDCSYEQQVLSNKNITSAECKNIRCKCIPGRMLCGEAGSLDISEFLVESVRGPGRFKCTELEGRQDMDIRTCSFEEPAMNDLITSFFGDAYFSLDCYSGECMHYTQVPGFVNPHPGKRFGKQAMILTAASAIFIVLGALGLVMYVAQRQERMARIKSRGKYDQLIESLLGQDSGDGPRMSPEEQEAIRRKLLMTGHKPMSLAWKNISYVVDMNRSVQPVEVFNDAASTASRAPSRSWRNLFGLSSPTTPSRRGVRLEEQEGLVESALPQVQQGQLLILDNLNGVVKPGSVCAIMGGSGAGKTTFLDILALKKKSGKVSGDILVNGKTMKPNDYKRCIGYVDQEDSLMDTLTVRETITYSALLRLPRDMSMDAKLFRVRETMIELGILGIADRRIGKEGDRGISGGEKRRVSIACELVTSPSILYLDEPTSGLDSYNAYNVVECLVNLARNYNRTVVMTIHQPRSNIYALFDTLVLLAKGKMIYAGPAQQEALQHFKSLGFDCPVGFNMADYLVDLTMHVIEADQGIKDGPIREQQEEELYTPHDGPNLDESRRQGLAKDWANMKDHLESLQQGYNQSEISHNVQQEINSLISGAREEQPARVYGDGNIGINGVEVIGDDDFVPPEMDWNKRASWWTQFNILSGRTFKNLYRNPSLLLAHYLISLVVAVLCGALFWQVSNDLAGFQNRLGFFFFVCALFGFSCLSSLQVFASQRVIFVRERANRYYSPLTYFAAKVLFDIIPLRVIPPLILGLIVYPMIGLRADSAFYMMKFLLVLVLFNLTAASTCLFIGIVFKELGVANLVSSLVMLFAMLFGGLLLNKFLASMPKNLSWLQEMSFFNYALEALIVNEVNGLTLNENKFGLQIDVPGATVLETFGFKALAFWQDTLKLFLYFLAMTFLAFLWLQFRVKERR